jgi:hypothetical protein
MSNRASFYPPKPGRVAIGIGKALLPFALRRWCGVYRLSISDDDLDKLRRATAGRCIIAPNHPSRVEPFVVADLARRTGRMFYFVSALENFEEPLGKLFLQRMGAYSIARGLPDRTSIEMTRTLLAEKDRPVVLFPEGEIYHHNDLMLPLNPGVAQIGFWALADLVKLGKDARLPILPIAVKYRFLGDVRAYMLGRIERLEGAVGIGKPVGDWRDRIHAIGEKIVATLEARYRLPSEGAFADRIERIRCCIFSRGFAILGADPPKEGAPASEQMRALFNTIRAYRLEFEHPETEYEEKIGAQRMTLVEMVTDDLARMHDSILTTGHYVSDAPTFERLSELLVQMEDEVFGKHVRYPRRAAIVKVADPVDLRCYSDDYGKNKRATVAAATAEIARRVSAMLDSLRVEGAPIPADLWPNAT